jgi:23S rRNA (uracil1939-C5)-methyltransferase
MTRRSRNAALAPIEEGEISGLSHDGAGVCRDGKAAFVDGALPGERVRFQRHARHRSHDAARLVEVLQASPDRVVPRCAHFGVCGGCALQHLAPAAQLALKQQELADALARIGQAEPAEWLAPLAGPVWNYRRRARLGAKYVRKKGRTLVGFRERAGPFVADLAACEILVPPVDRLITPLAALIEGLSIREALPQIEVAVGDVATLVMRVLEAPSPADLAAFAAFEVQHECRILLQPGGLDTIRRLDGAAPEPLVYRLPRFELEYEFLPSDFVQVNAAINERMVELALEQLALDAGSSVLDLFCGLGNFTLPVARTAASVVGVEGDAGLVERARGNARRNGLGNAQFHVANLMDEALGEPAWARGRYSHVLLDPPRAGAREVLPLVARLAEQRIVYISCHPGSLARDVGELVQQHGWQLLRAGVIDMFPHTTHVESVVVLEPGAARRRA